MNKELQKNVEAIKQLGKGLNVIYFNMPDSTKTQVFIENEAFNEWFDEYEIEPHGAGTYYTKYAFCEGIKFYALYEWKDLSEEDKQRLREQAYEAIENL